MACHWPLVALRRRTAPASDPGGSGCPMEAPGWPDYSVGNATSVHSRLAEWSQTVRLDRAADIPPLPGVAICAQSGGRHCAILSVRSWPTACDVPSHRGSDHVLTRRGSLERTVRG